MREERTVQGSIFDLFSPHEIGRELAAMSAWLDGEAAVVRLVAADLGIGSGQADRAPRAERRCGVALRAAQAVLPAELRGAGLFCCRIRHRCARSLDCRSAGRRRSRRCTAAHRRHRRRHLRVPQPDAAGARRDGQAGERRQGPGSTARSPRPPSMRPPTPACCGMPCGSWCGCCVKPTSCCPPCPGATTRAWPRSAPAPSSTVVATTGSGFTASCSPRPARRSPICHDAMARLADDPAPVAAAWRAEAEQLPCRLIERIIDQTERRVLPWREGAGRRQARQSVRTP